MSSLDKGLRILGLLNQQRPALRVGEVCRTLGIPKSSVSRLLKTMADHGVLTQTADQGYEVGPRALELSGLYLARHGLFERLDAVVDTLIHEFRFVSYICSLDQHEVLILRRKYGDYPLRPVRDVGQRVPAFQTAAGRVLLACGTDDRARTILSRDPRWANRIEEALAILRETRRAGVTTVPSNSTPGVAAIAAAVNEPATGEMLGISLSFPTSATDAELRARMARRLREEAMRVGVMLGDRNWTARQSELTPRSNPLPIIPTHHTGALHEHDL